MVEIAEANKYSASGNVMNMHISHNKNHMETATQTNPWT